MKNEFTDSFIEEASVLLLQLEDDILELESKPDNPAIINNIFRVMHTLKGSAGMVGFNNVQNLTHEFESLYDQVREGLLSISKEITNLTLSGRDLLLSMLKGNEDQESVERIIRRIRDAISPCTKEDIVKSVKPDNEHLYFIWFKPAEGIFERGLDPDRVISEILSAGKVHIILHEGETSWEQQKKEKVCQTGWEVYLRTSLPPESAEEIFLFYHEDEFGIFPVIEAEQEPDPALEEILKVLYKDEADHSEHLKRCFNFITEPAIVKEMPLLQKEKITERKVESVTPEKQRRRNDATVNVPSHKLDELMNLVSELVTLTDMFNDQLSGLNDHRLNNSIESIEKLTKKFRNNALDLRLVPVGSLFTRLKRPVRDLSNDLGKNLNLLIEGMDIEIDKTILKSIESPLTHIIRNSIDHGIEPPEERLKKGKPAEGLLKITAFYSGASVIIQVQDDGRGINLERVRECAIKKGLIQQDQVVSREELISFIMEPGFTTSDNVSMVSGRGVGMDVVRKELSLVSGSLEVFTEKDLGTSITMKLPATLTIIDTLMVDVAETRILIPVMDIEYCFKASQEELNSDDNRYIQYKNYPIPLVSLRTQFGYPSGAGNEQMVIVINKFDRRYAIISDRIIGEHQAVIKPLGSLFVNQPYFSGGSIMVDGKLALILDTNFLFNHVSKLVLS